MSYTVSRQLAHRRSESEASRMGNVFIAGTSAGMMAGAAIALLVMGPAPQRQRFDYARCAAVVADLEHAPVTAPRTALGFKEATRTPEGRWCIN